jgi:adenylate cyclase
LGINTGDMVVGNMGTPNKMDYTIMGNAVNLAARLEGVNKQYNTGGILISEYTREHIDDEFILRPLSRVRVVGINTPLRLYELLDIRDEAPPELLVMVKSWEQAFAAYERRDFLAAQNIFHMIFQRSSADLAAKKYLDRCTKYLTAPPDDAAWDDGVDNLPEKERAKICLSLGLVIRREIPVGTAILMFTPAIGMEGKRRPLSRHFGSPKGILDIDGVEY